MKALVAARKYRSFARCGWLRKPTVVGLQIVPNPKAKRLDFQIIVEQRGGWVDQAEANTKVENPKFDGTVIRGSATCPSCGYTTPVARVREQLKMRRGGTNDARLLCVITTRVGEQGRSYRSPTNEDTKAVSEAKTELERRKDAHTGRLSLVPNEEISLNEIRRISSAAVRNDYLGGTCSASASTLLSLRSHDSFVS